MLAILGGGGLAACAPRTEPAAPPGLTFLRSYSALESWLLLRLAGVKGVKPRRRIDCYRLSYPTHDSDGRGVTATGMVALPRGAKAKGLVSFQHGTTTTRTAVPSNLSTDGLAGAILFGGAGYVAVAPDYLGLGGSKGPHPYLVAGDAARAVIDLIVAARRVEGVPSTPPFMVGFSQGGHASLAALRTLEAAGQAVLGVAAIAGPHNLLTISFKNALRGGSPQHSLYLAYTARGYAARYGQPLASLLAPAYVALVPDLFDRPHTPEEIIAALPVDPRALFTPRFLVAYDTGGRHWFLDAMAANEVSGFTPKAPVRLYYGGLDRDVPPEEAIATARRMTAAGADARAVDVGAVGHDPSALEAAPMILEWLEALSASPNPL